MWKRNIIKPLKICGVVAGMCMILSTTACEIEDAPKKVEVKSLTNTWDNFDLIADKNTGIIYYYFDNSEGYSLCPYYSENGKLCKFEDGKIIEIGE